MDVWITYIRTSNVFQLKEIVIIRKITYYFYLYEFIY